MTAQTDKQPNRAAIFSYIAAGAVKPKKDERNDMEKQQVLKKLMDCGVVAVVRATGAEQAEKIAEACLAAGIVGIEITFTVPDAAWIIETLAKRYVSGGVVIGAGTVLDAETARAAILAGAQFIVSPCLSEECAKLCLRYQVPYLPGAMTVKEVVNCLEAGADIIKIFPGSVVGPEMIAAVRGPLPQARMMPTGGVSAGNIADWIRAGAVAVGAGSDLTKGAKTGDYAAVTETGRAMVEAVRAARAEQ